MLDVFFVAEFSWVYWWFRTRSRFTLWFSIAGLFTAGLAASAVSDWLTTVLVPPTSATFRWIESQVSSHVQSVLLNELILPETAGQATGSTPNQWIAYSVLKGLFFVAITAAVFLSFTVLAQLVRVLKNQPDVEPLRRSDNWIIPASGALYATVLTVLATGNLAWFHALAALDPPLNASLTIRVTVSTLHFLHLLQ